MTLFGSADEVYDTVGELCRRMLIDDELGPMLAGLDMSMRMSISDPDAAIVLDCRRGAAKVDFGEVAYPIDTELQMSADNAHKLWLGDLNPTLAMASRKIKPSGNIKKAMGLSQILAPASEMYRSLLQELDRQDLLTK